MRLCSRPCLLSHLSHVPLQESDHRSSRHKHHRRNFDSFQTSDSSRFATPMPVPGVNCPVREGEEKRKRGAPPKVKPHDSGPERMTSLKLWHSICDGDVVGGVFDMVPEVIKSQEYKRFDATRVRASRAVWERGEDPPKLTRVRQGIVYDTIASVPAIRVVDAPVQSSFVRSFMESRPSKSAMDAMAVTETRRRDEATIAKEAEEAARAAVQAVNDAYVAAQAHREKVRAKKEADALAKEEAEEKAALGGWEEQAFDPEVSRSTFLSLNLPHSCLFPPRSFVSQPCPSSLLTSPRCTSSMTWRTSAWGRLPRRCCPICVGTTTKAGNVPLRIARPPTNRAVVTSLLAAILFCCRC
jgi:hypothetical protein